MPGRAGSVVEHDRRSRHGLDADDAVTSTVPIALDTDRLRAVLTRFNAPVFCHVPGEVAFDAAALDRDGDGRDRWSEPDQPTAYLAGDALTAIAEFARHADRDAPAIRTVIRIQLGPVGLLDIRREDVRAALGCPPDDVATTDRQRARAIATSARAAGVGSGLIVPSMAFLDQPDRFNVVLFGERIAGGVAAALARPEA